MMIIPEKLQKGDEIRIIAPSRSATILTTEGVGLPQRKLEELGFIVSFGRHIFECDLQHSSSIEHVLLTIGGEIYMNTENILFCKVLERKET